MKSATVSSKRGGFTLAEVVFAMAITVMASAGIGTCFLIVSRVFLSGSNELAVQAAIGTGLEQISSSISAAEDVEVQAGGNRIDLKIPATTLASDVSNGDTTITVIWTKVLPPSGLVFIGPETISYGGKTSTTLTSCTRGYGGTTAESHEASEVVYFGAIYYYDGGTIYLNVDGNPNPAGDTRVLSDIENTDGKDLFTAIDGGGSYKTNRITVALTCSKGHEKQKLELELELFARNDI